MRCGIRNGDLVPGRQNCVDRKSQKNRRTDSQSAVAHIRGSCLKQAVRRSTSGMACERKWKDLIAESLRCGYEKGADTV